MESNTDALKVRPGQILTAVAGSDLMVTSLAITTALLSVIMAALAAPVLFEEAALLLSGMLRLAGAPGLDLSVAQALVGQVQAWVLLAARPASEELGAEGDCEVLAAGIEWSLAA